LVVAGYLDSLGLVRKDTDVGKDVTVKLTGHTIRAQAGVISWTKTREYWEKRPLPLIAVIVFTIGSPFLGLFLAGWIGVLVGLVVSIAAFAGGIFAITRVREITLPDK
jgi:hypothetical protein